MKHALLAACFSLSTVATLATRAADVRDTPCRTTEECQQEANRIRGVITQNATSALARAQDEFYWVGRINMASTVMLLEEGIIPARLAKPIAGGVQHASTQLMLLRAHNIPPGMTDYKGTYEPSRTFVWAVEMLHQFNGVMKALRIDAKRSLEELEGDWTTSMELAETLQRLHQVPFRVGHHFATIVVNHAKAHNLLPAQFPYTEAVKLYTEAAQKYSQTQTQLPLNESTFKATLSPEMMVRTRVGIGGPQPAEVHRMIGAARDSFAKDRAWVAERNTKLLEAEARLNNAFAKYLGN